MKEITIREDENGLVIVTYYVVDPNVGKNTEKKVAKKLESTSFLNKIKQQVHKSSGVKLHSTKVKQISGPTDEGKPTKRPTKKPSKSPAADDDEPAPLPIV